MTSSCIICGIQKMSDIDSKKHLNGRRHRKNHNKQFISACDICDIQKMSNTDVEKHLNGRRHRKNLAINLANSGIFNKLEYLNNWLIKLGELSEQSVSNAHKSLKSIHVNIFDLLNENYIRRSLSELKSYTRKNKLYFPLNRAKEENLRSFLKRIF